MSALTSLGKAVFSRTTLGLVLLLVLGLALWFGGPYLGVGELRPLEDAGVRIMILSLVLAFVLFWLLHWPVSVVGGAALCLLIWYGSPLLVVGDSTPFAPDWVRLTLVGGIALIFCIYLGRKIWLALQADNALLRKLLHPTADSPAREQIKELQHGMRKALSRLRTVRSEVSGLKRLFQHSRYIYELPWYMIFGAPGTGKTTLLLNSGLKFPLAEAGLLSGGVQGTRNCVWWFTDEAVLIDTAGRYTTHESNAEVDAAEWKGFLGLLRKHRPRAPLNGALVAVSVEELAGASAADLNRLAATLRERLSDLQDELGVSFPVYVLITKMDLIRGFRAYFQNLNSEGRRQVFGFTLPRTAKDAQAPLADIRQTCEGELRLLIKRLEQGLNARLHEEFAPERRRELYCLPGDFNELSGPLMRLVESVFFESRYGASSIRHLLRGVYFTSAVQEDATLPLNTHSLLRRLGHAVQNGVSSLGRALSAPRTQVDNRSYFLEHTLRRVVFPEAFLVRPNTRWELRFVLARSLGHALVLLLALGLGWALIGSADNNARLLETLDQRVDSVEARLQDGADQRAAMTAVLEQACTLTLFPDVDLASPPFSYRVGLFSGTEANAAAGELCVSLREYYLLPRFSAQLEANLAQAVTEAGQGRGSSPERLLRLYEALRLYAMFHDPARFNAGALMDWFVPRVASGEAGELFRDNPSLLDALRQTLARDARFTRPAPVRPELLAAAREALLPAGRDQRLYFVVRQTLAAEAPEDFLPLRHAGEDGALVRAGGTLADPIPGLFTYAGYHEVFLPRLDDLLPAALETDIWLMADARGRGFLGDRSEVARLNRALRTLYYEDYARIWGALVGSIHAGAGASPEQDLLLLHRLGSGDSPLDRLARAVVRETALSAKDADVGDQLAAQAGRRLRSATRTTNLQFGNVDEAARVDRHFAALRALVTGSAAPASARTAEVKPSPELEEIRLLLTEFALFSRDLHKAKANRALPPSSDITERLLAKAQQSPPFISNVLRDLADRGLRREGVSKGEALTALVEQTASPCARLTSSRYPFVPDGRDADPAEFSRVFGPGGIIDTTFTTSLAPLVDSSASPWTYLDPLPGSPDLEPFERAAALRQALYGTGQDKLWRVPLRVNVVDMDPRIERLELHIGGQTLRYAHGPDNPLDVVWESGGSSQIALSALPRNLGIKALNLAGPWALFRLLDRGTVINRVSAEEIWVEFDLNGHSVTLSLLSQSPLGSDLFRGFVCPGEMPPPAVVTPVPKTDLNSDATSRLSPGTRRGAMAGGVPEGMLGAAPEGVAEAESGVMPGAVSGVMPEAMSGVMPEASPLTSPALTSASPVAGAGR